MSSPRRMPHVRRTPVPPHRGMGRAIAGELPSIAVIVALALATHALFLPTLAGAAAPAFAYAGGDSVSQLAPAVSLLERSLADGGLGWSFEYGLGGDLFGQLAYYYSTSPFFYLQFAVKSLMGVAGGSLSQTLEAKLVASIVKQAFCMTLMYALVRREGHGRALGVCAAAVYGCSPWFADTTFAFDFMADAMLWPPLIVLALEHIDRGGSWIPLAICVGVAVASNFYFAYVTAAFCVALALAWGLWRGGPAALGARARAYLGRLGRLAGVFAAGVALAAVALVPSAVALSHADRFATATTSELLPSLGLVAVLPEALFGRGGAYVADASQCYLFPLSLLLAPCLRWRDLAPAARRKSVLAGALLLLWLVPAFSSLMNAGSYPTTRWCYLVCFCVAWALPDLVGALVSQRRASLPAAAAVAVLAVLALATRDLRATALGTEAGYSFAPTGAVDVVFVVAGVASIVALWLWQRASGPAGRRGCGPAGAHAPARSRWSAGACAAGYAAALLVGIVLAMPYGPYAAASGFRDSDGVSAPMTAAEVDDAFDGGATSKAAYAALAGEEGFSRLVDDQSVRNAPGAWQRDENRTWVLGGHGTSLYSSMTSRTLNRALKYDYDVTSTIDQVSQYRGLGHRLMLEEAWGIGHKVNVTDGENLFGYVERGEDGIWDNTRCLGMDLWYPCVTSEGVADDWSPASRDAAILQTAALDTDDLAAARAAGVPEHMPDLSTVDETTLSAGDVAVENGELAADGTLIAFEGGATVTVVPPQGAPSGPGEWLLSATVVRPDGQGWTFVANGESYIVSAAGSHWDYPQDAYSVCFPGEDDLIAVSVPAGTYQVSNARLARNSYERLDGWVAQAESARLDGLEVSTSHVAGSVDAPTSGVLALSIPYDEGWVCTVDGKPARLLKVNSMMVGVALSSGEHRVELTYRTPGLLAGAAVTLATAVALTAVGIARRRRSARP